MKEVEELYSCTPKSFNGPDLFGVGEKEQRRKPKNTFMGYS